MQSNLDSPWNCVLCWSPLFALALCKCVNEIWCWWKLFAVEWITAFERHSYGKISDWKLHYLLCSAMCRFLSIEKFELSKYDSIANRWIKISQESREETQHQQIPLKNENKTAVNWSIWKLVLKFELYIVRKSKMKSKTY